MIIFHSVFLPLKIKIHFHIYTLSFYLSTYFFIFFHIRY
nr:MAG TPA: hypothetical protein [Caudoviricetes sp.]